MTGLENFKSHFCSDSPMIHLNNSGQGLIPDVHCESTIHWLQRFYQEGSLCAMDGWAQTEVSRQKLASFIGASPEEIAFFQTTASAISQAAFGIPLQTGDEILTWDQEYPSNFYPWRMAAEKAGAKLIQVKSIDMQTPASELLKHIGPRTKVIAISWVQYQGGAVTDLKFLSDQLKGKNIWLVADVIQGVGVRPFHFHQSGFDIVCGGSHKFLCSAYGASYMAIKKSRIEELSPIEFGAMSFGNPDTEKSFSLQPRPGSSRFEPGSKSMFEVIALGACLDLFIGTGIELIYHQASRLADNLRTGLADLGFVLTPQEGPILNFTCKDAFHLQTISNLLTENQVAFAVRGGGIRLSTHAYNSDRDVSAVLNCL